MAIVFLHLQKTGGGTVHSLLQARFPAERFAERTRAGHIAWKAYRDSDDVIVSGHVTAAEVRHYIRNPRIFTVLREPKSRLLSHYYFLKSHTVEVLATYDSPLLLRIKGMSLEEFLEDAEIEDWLRDFYVKNLDPERNKQGGDLARACAFLSSCEVVGTTNELGSFAGALFKALDLAPPDAIPRVNSLAGRKERPGYDPVEVAAPSPAEKTLLRKYAANDKVLFRLAKALAPVAADEEPPPGLMGSLLKRLSGRGVRSSSANP
jgi:hypothetical protein